MKRTATNVSFLLFVFLMSTSVLQGQDLIEVISSFSASNLNAINCQGTFNVSGGSSLCVTDLEGSCVTCGTITNQFGANNSQYRISGIDVSEYCEVIVTVIASGVSTNGDFEGLNQCGTDRIRVRLSSGGNSEQETTYPSGDSWGDAIVAVLPVTGSSLTIDIEIGTQESGETLCIEEVIIEGGGEGIDIQPRDSEPFCVGETAKLRLSGENPNSETYQWVGPNGFTSTDPEPTIPNVSTDDEGLYICFVENSSGCIAEVEFELFVIEAGPGNLNLDSTPDQACEGDNISLRAKTENPDNGNFIYQWFFNGNLIAGQTDDRYNISNLDNTDNGVYEVFVIDLTAPDNCAEADDDYLLEVLEGPGNISAGLLDNYCVGDGKDVILQANTGNNGDYQYVWFDNNNNQVDAGLNLNQINLGQVNQELITFYFVQVFDPNTLCGLDEDPAEIEVFILDGPGQLVGDLSYTSCGGGDLTLQADPTNAGNYEVNWIYPDNTDETFIAPTGTITLNNVTDFGNDGIADEYSVILIDQSTGCFATKIISVLVGDSVTPPSVSTTGGSCNEVAELTGTVDTDLTLVWYNDIGAADNDFIATGSPATDVNTGQVINTAGTYYAAAYSATFDCYSARVEIELGTGNTLNTTITTDQNICEGESVSLTATGGTTYQWSNNATGPTINVTPTNSSTFTVTISDGSDCEATESVSVTVAPRPNITVAQAAACPDGTFTEYGLVISTAAGSSVSTNPTADITDLGGGDFELSNLPVGTNVAITVTSAAGCVNTQTIPSAECGCPTIAAPIISNETVACADEPFSPLSVQAPTDPNTEIRWYTVPTGGTFIATGAILPLTTPGTYYAEVYNTNNDCQSGRTALTLTLNAPPNPQINGANNICTGEQTTITATDLGGDAISFLWNDDNASTTASIMVGAGTYTVTISNSAGCQNEASFSIGTFPNPQASISGDLNVCPNETTTLTASGGESYAWSTNATGEVVNVPNGTYSVTVTDANGCEDIETVTVDLNSLPTLTSIPSADCSTDRTSYTAQVSTQAANTLIVNGGIGTLFGGNGNFTISDIPAGQSITVTLTNAANCSIQETINAPQCTCPNITAPQPGNAVEVCVGQTPPALTVSANLDADSQIRWFDAMNGGTQLAIGTSLNATTSGIYFAEVYNNLSDCASQRVAVELIIHPEAIATIVGPNQVCPNEEVNLTAALNSGTINSITWSTGTNFDATIPVGAGVYEVTITDENNCQATASKTITEFTVTPPSISGNLEICPDETTELVASGGVSYTWSNFAGSDRVTVSAGAFTVTATDNNGCESMESVTVIENTAPTITESSAAACADDLESYSLSISTESDATATSTQGTVSGNNGQFTISDIPKNTPVEIIVQNAAGCTTSRTFGAPACECPSLAAPQAANTNFAICEGENLPTLNVSNAGVNNDAEIRWYNSATGGGAIAIGFNFTPSEAGNYYAEIFNTINNCPSSRTEIRLVVNTNPTANITGATTVCPDGTSTLNVTNATSYAWSNNANTQSVEVGAGMYEVTITDANNCTAIANTSITEFTVTPPSISGNLAICPGESTELVASGGVSYTWSNFAGSDRVTVSAGTFTVTATDSNGCESMESVIVTQNAAPTITESSAAACADDLESYSLSISTESDATATSTQGTVSGNNGQFTISDIPKNTAVEVVVQNAAGCTTSRTFGAPACECPTLSAPQATSTNVVICENEAFPALTVSNAGVNSDAEIRWYSSATGGTAIATGFDFIPSAAGNYYAEVFNTLNNCTSSRTEISFVINRSPVVGIIGGGTICPNTVTQITATNSASYLWSANANNAVTQSVDVGAGTYTVTVTGANGCSTTATKTVEEFPTTQVVVSGELAICPDETTELTASGSTNYTWSNFANSDRVSVAAGTFTVTGMDDNGCESMETVTVIENAAPSLTLVDGLLACADNLETYQFQISTELGNTLSTNLGTVSGGGGFFNIVGVSKNTPVTVTIQTAEGCEISQEFQAPDCSCPSLAAPQSFGNMEVCADVDLPALSVSGAGMSTDAEVRWYNTATGGTAIATGLAFTPEQAGTYYAEIFNTITNCQSPRTEINLVVNDLPEVTITGAEEVCPNVPTELIASISQGTAISYQWSSNAANATTPSVGVGVGIYTVTVTDANNCINTATQFISEFSVTQATISGNLSVCPDEETVLTASNGASYNWNNFAQTNQISVEPGDYIVTVTDANGCNSTVAVEVTEDAAPSITLVNGLVACADDLETYGFDIITEAGNELTLSSGIVAGSNGTFTISEATKDIPVTITVTNPATGCMSEQVVNAPDCSCPSVAAPQNSSASNFEICTGTAIPTFLVSNSGVNSESEIRWYTSATGGTAIAMGLGFTPEQAGTYFAEIFNTTNECTSPRTAFELVINELPTANIVGANEVCPDTETTLDAGNASNYRWSNGATTQTIEVGAGTYSLTITDLNGCEAIADQAVTEFVVTPVTISGAIAVCPDETSLLTASGGLTYEWSNFAMTDQINIGAGTYSVTATDTNGCETTASETIVENTPPSLALSTDLACASDLETYSLGITTEAANSLSASLGQVSGANGLFQIENITKDIPVTIIVTNAEGCETTQTFEAPNCDCPQLAAPMSAGDRMICENEAIPTLSVTSPDLTETVEIRWYNVDINGIVLATGTDFRPTVAGTYFAEVFNVESNCQSSRTAVNLSINPLPTASITGEENLCPAETTTLVANQANSYLWSNGANTQSIEVGAGDYTLMITDENGCENSTAISINEFTVSEAFVSGDNIICPNESTTLTASPGTSFEWSTDETTNTIEVRAGSYLLVVTDENGCESTANFAVEETTAPTFTLTQDANCASDLTTYSLALQTDSENTITADAGTVEDLGSGNWQVTNIPTDQDVELVIENAETCKTVVPFTAPDCSCPSLSAPINNGDIEVCLGTAFPDLSVSFSDETLTANWYDAASGGNLLAENTASFSPNATGVYFAEAIDLNTGCTSNTRTPVRLTELDLPVITLSEERNVCPNQTLTLGANTPDSDATYIWNTTATTASIEVGAGAYSVRVIDSNNCENRASATIEELVGPTASITGDEAYCAGESAILTASGADNILWSTNENTTSIEVQAGMYSATVTDANACEDTASFSVGEIALPTINIATQATCSDDKETYSIEISTEDGNILTASAGDVSGANGIFRIENITKDTPLELSISNANGCANTQNIAAPDCSCPELAIPSVSEDTAICEGDELPTFTASSVDLDETRELRWYDVSIDGVALASGTDFTPSAAGTYFVELIEPVTGCATTRTAVTLSINDLPIASITGDTEICPNESTELEANNAESYLWSTGETRSVIEVTAGAYSLTITDENNCQNTTSIELTEFAPIPASIDGNLTICEDGSTILTANEGATYLWSNSFETSQSIEVGIGTYSVTVSDVNGCTSVATVNVEERAALTLTIVDNLLQCTNSGLFYQFDILTDPGNNVTATAGTVVQVNETLFTVQDVPIDSPVAISIIDMTTGCSSQQLITAPDCSCPQFASPSISGLTAICEGDELPTFTASSADLDETRELRWYDVSVDGIALATGTEFTPQVAGTYFVELIEPATGCATVRTAVTFSINENPTASITGDASYCEGESATLTASGEGGLLWSTGDTDLNIEVQAGTYSVTVTNASGCTDTAAFSVSENALPSINLATQAACSDDGETYRIEINTEAGNVVASSIGTASGGANGIFSIENITKDTPVEITVLSPNGCERIQSFDAPNCDCPEFALPTVSEDAAICVGEEFPTFMASSPDLDETRELRWYDTDLDGTALATATEFTPSAAGIYFVELIEPATGCATARVAVRLTINELPVLSVTGEMNICEDESTNLTASGAEEYTWSTGDTGASLEVSQSAVYNVVGTDANGCSNSADFIVNVLAKPDISLDAPAALCEDATATVTASGGDTYTWSTGDTGASLSLGAGTYTVNASNAAGCSEAVEFTIAENSASEPTLITRTSCDENEIGEESLLLQNAAGCDSLVIITTTFLGAADCNLQFSLTAEEPACAAEASGSVNVMLSNGTAPFTYTWQSLDGRTGEGNLDATNFEITDLSSGEYEFIVTDANGQQSTQVIELFEPMALAIDLATSNFDGFGVTCPGDTNGRVEANVSGGTAPYNYAWNTNSEDALLLNLAAGEYILNVTDANGCISVATANISEPPAIAIAVDTDAAACEESTNGTLNIMSIQNADLPVEYSLNGTNFRPIDGFPFQIDDLAFGDYTLYIQDMRDCIESIPVSVAAAETAFAEIVVNANDIKAGETVQLELVTNLVPSKINWTTSTGDSLSCNNCLTPTATPNIGTTYRVEVTDENGCTATARVLVFVEGKQIVFANAFSPNDDGANDIFYIQGGDELVAVNYLHIFDRWGDLVFSINEAFPPNDIRYGWDGYINNELAATAVYTFLVEVAFEDGRTEIIGGDLTLSK